MNAYTITTDAVSATIEAESADAAAAKFASGEGRALAGVSDVDSLIEAVEAIGDGAWVQVAYSAGEGGAVIARSAR